MPKFKSKPYLPGFFRGEMPAPYVKAWGRLTSAGFQLETVVPKMQEDIFGLLGFKF